MFRDLLYSARTLFKSPGFTTVVLLTLVLGIGANSAIFSVVEAVLLRPLPYPEAERIVRIWAIFAQRDLPPLDASEGEVLDYAEQSQTLEALGAYVSAHANLQSGGEPERLLCTYTSAGFFRALGVEPAMGRIYIEEDVPGGPRATVLSHTLWQRRFAADEAILGKPVLINGRQVTVVGVMPPGFRFPEKTELWMPLQLDPSDQTPRSTHYLGLIARLKPQISLEQAQGEMSAIAREFEKTYPQDYPADHGWGIRLVPLADEVIGDSRGPLRVLAAAVGLVLLIACVNVTNLFLARVWSRRGEVAIRLALGASKGRLIRQFVSESMLLVLCGGALGLLLAHTAIRVLLSANPDAVARAEGIGLNPKVFGFTLGLSLLLGLLLALVPALQALRTDLNTTLREEGGKTTASGRHQLLRRLLVGFEVALALMLLISAGLMIKSFTRLTQVDPGFRAERLLTLQLTLPSAKYGEDHQVAQFFDQLLERVESLPGVVSASAVSFLPMSDGINRSQTIGAEGVPFGPSPVEPGWRSVDHRYLDTMGIKLVEGRTFTAGDDAQATRTAIVDEVLARRLWPQGGAVGRRIKVGAPVEENPNPWMTVVGVTQEVKQLGLDVESRGTLYYPLPQNSMRSQFLVVRTELADPLRATSAVRAEISALDPELAVADIHSMEQRLAGSVAEPRFAMRLLSIFALMAAFLAAVGIYGVVAYAVHQRTHEIGLRQALGAQRSDIFRLVVGHGMVVVVIGGAVGLVGAWWATQSMQSMLYGVTTRDPMVFIAVPMLLAAIGLLANLVPAWRAAKLDPARALHTE